MPILQSQVARRIQQLKGLPTGARRIQQLSGRKEDTAISGRKETATQGGYSKIHSEVYQRRVLVVDTSCEIGGFGLSPHWAIGDSTRRMSVADRNKQHDDMLMAVQNHTPEVLVIDEIGSQAEVSAAAFIGFPRCFFDCDCTCKKLERGYEQ